MTPFKSSMATLAIAVVLTCLWSQSARASSMIGPILPYFSVADSPFAGLPFSYSYLETYEEGGAPTVPGMVESGGAVIGPGNLVDSVEGIKTGHDYFSNCGSCGVTFTFNAAALGGHLPTHVGIVWTDGDGPSRTFQAYDANNALIGTITDSSQLFFSTGGDGVASNYRFFGAIDSAGISSIFIANDSGGIEVDDLQYGYLAPQNNVPEPSSLLLLVTGLLAVGPSIKRKIIA